MAFQPPYLVAIKNLDRFLDALRNAQAPSKLSVRFVEKLGFKSTNDRLFIPLLKAMSFVDESGKPTARFHSFLDDSEWQRVLADGMRDAYSELFRINKNAQNLSREQLRGKLKSLGEGKLSVAVVNNAVKTFLELAKLADFSEISTKDVSPQSQDYPEDSTDPESSTTTKIELEQPDDRSVTPDSAGASLVYRIEIVLPAVRDQAVYDAIFRSARHHLIK